MSQKECLLQEKVIKNIRCNYLLFLPAGYHKSRKRWPLILFLHGSGERGDDLNLVKKHGLAKIVERDPDFPFVSSRRNVPRTSGGPWMH